MKTLQSIGSVAMCTALLVGCGSKSTRPTDDTAPTTQPTASATVKLNAGPPVDGPVTMTVPPSAIAGSKVAIVWNGPANTSDYIDLVPRQFTGTSGEITYQYVRDGLGRAELRVPTTPGDYDVRYVLDMGSTRLVKATAPLQVTAAAATVKAPAEAGAAEALAVEWTGPQGEGDYIDIVPAGAAATSGEISYAYTSAGTPAKLTAPGGAGDYAIRYVLEGPTGRKVLATAALKVSMPVATLKTPVATSKGATFEVTWAGPQRVGDYVDLVPKGHEPTSGELSYFYTSQGATGSLTAPQQAGVYEIRYVMEAPKGRVVLNRAPLVVK